MPASLRLPPTRPTTASPLLPPVDPARPVAPDRCADPGRTIRGALLLPAAPRPGPVGDRPVRTSPPAGPWPGPGRHDGGWRRNDRESPARAGPGGGGGLGVRGRRRIAAGRGATSAARRWPPGCPANAPPGAPPRLYPPRPGHHDPRWRKIGCLGLFCRVQPAPGTGRHGFGRQGAPGIALAMRRRSIVPLLLSARPLLRSGRRRSVLLGWYYR